MQNCWGLYTDTIDIGFFSFNYSKNPIQSTQFQSGIVTCILDNISLKLLCGIWRDTTVYFYIDNKASGYNSKDCWLLAFIM